MFSNRDRVLIQTIIRNICILGLFLWILPAQAQQEVNVKLKQEGKLSSFLTSYQDSEKSSSTIRQLFPYLDGMSSAQQLHLRKEKSGLEKIYSLSFPGSKNATQLIDLLASSGEFEFVEPNYRRKVHALEMAPMGDSTSAQWYHQFIQTFEAWDLSRGSSDVKIGVLDTGLDFGHPEFEGQIGVNEAEDLNGNGSFEPWPISENRGGLTGDFDGIDNDQNGFTDDVSGYDFTDQIRSPFVGDYLDPDPNPQDDNNHGTQVAGVIGARADNQIGGVGIAPDCKLVVLRAFSALGMGDDDDIARAIVYAADNGIDVLVMSFGDLFPSLTMHEAIKYAYEKGVVLVASAGNATGDELHYPSGFDEVISVSGTIFNEERNEETFWPLSSFGVTVDIAAPASDIFTTFIRDLDGSPAFGRIQGTSFSAPMVASAIGLLFSIRGKLPPRQVQGLLASTADDIGIEGWDHFTGAGRLNLFKLLSFSGSSTAEIISPVNDEGASGDVVSIVGTVLDPEFASFSLSWEEGVKGEENWTPIIENQTYQVNADTLTVWDVSDLEEGEYTLRLVINKTDGSTLEDRNRFVVDRSSPELKISVSSNAWDNEENKVFIDFRSNDRALHTLHFKKVGESEEKSLKFDQFTRTGHFLLGQESLSPGEYEMRVSATNRAGITGESAPFNISFQPASLPEHGFDSLTYGLPNGRYLPDTYDFDKDGLLEVIYSKYDRALRPGKIFISEFNGSRFVEVDSLDFKPILLPKDVGDTDQDGLLEIFCSISDSSFLVEQATDTSFPSEIIYENANDTLFASRMADITGDGVPELFYKNFKDHFVYQRSGDTFIELFTLEDISPNYTASVSPRIMVEDFDEDGGPEMIFGDFDGDIIGYEYLDGTLRQHFLSISDLAKSGNYLTAGDFDGDGQQEFFVAVHTLNMRNEEQERATPFWWLRMFDLNAEDSLVQVWDTYLYDRDSEVYNQATALNLDNDPAEELLFTNFPRAVVIEYNSAISDYEISWFFKESWGTHHVIGDFNGNGLVEFGIGDPSGSFMNFFEQNEAFNGPGVINSLKGTVRSPESVALNWLAVDNATSYRVIRINSPSSNPSLDTLTITTDNSFVDTGLISGQEYAYHIISLNEGLTPAESGMSNQLTLIPHALPRLDSVEVIRSNQLLLFFSEPVTKREGDKAKFMLNGSLSPISLIPQAEEKNSLILSFQDEFSEGVQTIEVDTSWLDKQFAPINPDFKSLTFTFEREQPDKLILSRWEVASENEAVLYFSQAVDPTTALEIENYVISPFGTISAVELFGENDDAVKLTLSEARLGALGFPVTITVNDVCTFTGVCISEDGNTATFSSNKSTLTEVYVYPNPVRNHAAFEGVRFANLTQQAIIKVYTVSGRYVIALEETDGDGGLQWNLRDVGNNRISPGIYLYHVSTNQEGIEEFVGKFTVVE